MADSDGNPVLTQTAATLDGVTMVAEEIAPTFDVKVKIDTSSPNSGGVAALTIDDAPAAGENLLLELGGFATHMFVQEINSDDWLLLNNAYFDGTTWQQPNASAPSTLIFQASGGEAIRFYTADAGELPTWTHGFSLEGKRTGSADLHRVYIGSNDADNKALDAGIGLTVQADDGDGTATTRVNQIQVIGSANANDKLELGLDSTGEFAVLQALEEGTGWWDVILAQSGGKVGIGSITDPTQTLQVSGAIHGTSFVDLTEIATPADPSTGIGRLYAATDGTLHWVNDASTDFDLTTGGGLSNVVEDTTPQLGGDLDGQGNNLDNMGVIFLQEQAAADADVAGSGQIWVKTATPNQLWFTDDAGTDVQLGVAASGMNDLIDDTTPQLGADLDANTFDIQFDDATGIRDDSDNEQLIFQKTASAVNHFEITNAATGNSPDLAAVGDDTNIAINLTPKGTGTVNFNATTLKIQEQAAAEADTAAYGQLWVKTATPNELWFTDDAGTDNQITPSLSTVITSVVDGELLRYDGADWINNTLAEAGIQAQDAFLDDIAALTDPGADRILFWDDTAGDIVWLTVGTGLAITTTTLATDDANIDHDALSNFVADEHVAHGGVTLTAGSGLSGGGTIAASRTFNVDIASETEDASPATNDWVLVEDNSVAGQFRKVQLTNLPGGGGGLSNVVEDTTPQLGGDLDANAFDIQFDDATGIRDDSDNEQLIFQKTASAVNHLEITNAATGSSPTIGAAGDDTNIAINLAPKGTGTVNIDNSTLSIQEQAAAEADVAGRGQLWVISNTPNELRFTDDAGTDFSFITNASTTKFEKTLSVNGAMLDQTNFPQMISSLNGLLPKLAFDDTTDEICSWVFDVPENYSANPELEITYACASATSGTAAWGGEVMCVSDGDAQDVDSASFDTINTDTGTVAGTAGHIDKINMPLTNNDSMAAGDVCIIRFRRDVSADSVTGDLELVSVTFKCDVTI